MADHEALNPRWFQILLALADRACNGSEIMKEVLERTGGAMHLWPGMLYGSLKAMAEEGLVSETEPPAGAEAGGGRPRYYAITRVGGEALRAEVARLDSWVEAARAKKAYSDSEPA